MKLEAATVQAVTLAMQRARDQHPENRLEASYAAALAATTQGIISLFESELGRRDARIRALAGRLAKLEKQV